MTILNEWWGFSKEHGWVIMDRSLPCNVPGLRGELLFFRCRNSKIFFLKRELWRLPDYQFAPNYVLERTGAAADEARAELDELMQRWPEFKAEIHRQHQEIVDRETEARREEERLQKKATAEAKKQQRDLKKQHLTLVEQAKSADPSAVT
jgi:hypothetical protein